MFIVPFAKSKIVRDVEESQGSSFKLDGDRSVFEVYTWY